MFTDFVAECRADKLRREASEEESESREPEEVPVIRENVGGARPVAVAA